MTRKRVPPATAAWRLCSRPTRAESRQREARIGRAWCRTRSTAYSTARAAERLTRCRPSACLQATRCSRRATRVEPPARTAAAASVPRRPPRQRLALPELLYLSSRLSHGFSNRLARDIVVIDVRFAPQLWIAEYAPGYEALRNITFEAPTERRQEAGDGGQPWLLWEPPCALRLAWRGVVRMLRSPGRRPPVA